MKKCDVCHQERSVECFHRNRRNSDGLHTTCKDCKRVIDKRYRENNKEKIKPRRHDYYLRNKDCIVKKTRRYIDENPDRRCLYSRQSRLRLKQEVFAHYCGGDVKCQCCPETEIDLLTIDHIDGNGSKHRRELGNSSFGGHSFYRWLRKHGYPNGFQVLCMGCQYRKRRLEMTPKNQTDKQEEKSAKVQELKVECLKHYGSVCPCGETDLVLLTLDHVNDDGAKHRRETNTRGFAFYVHLRKHNFPNDPPLQVLCIKCQFRKRSKNEQAIADNHLDMVRKKMYNEAR